MNMETIVLIATFLLAAFLVAAALVVGTQIIILDTIEKSLWPQLEVESLENINKQLQANWGRAIILLILIILLLL